MNDPENLPVEESTRARRRHEKLRRVAQEKSKGAARKAGRKLLSGALFLLVMLAVMYSGYRKVLFIPEDGSAFTVRDYSLGKAGSAPFYQTDRELELAREMVDLGGSLALRSLGKAYYDNYLKHFGRGRALTQYIRVGPDQLPDLYYAVSEACELLGVAEVPPVYLKSSAGTQMTVTNHIKPVIVISSDFTWAFKPDELRFLLARQVAHIRLNHVFYLDMLAGLRSMGSGLFSRLVSNTLLRRSLGSTLMEWYKEAEISADRGGLVVTGNAKVALAALVKLNIGANYEDQYGPVNVESYTRQLDDLGEHRVEAASAAIHELENPNPFLTVRCRHLQHWYEQNAAIFQ